MNAPTKTHQLSGFKLEKTVKSMKLSLSRWLTTHKNEEITVDQWVILNLLTMDGPMSQQALATAAFKDAPTVTRMLDLMETKKIVIRKVTNADRRKYLVHITDKGKKLYQGTKPLVEKFREMAYQNISPQDLMKMEKTLDQIFSNLTKIN